MGDKQRPPVAVIALGGNALSPPGERATITDQFRHTRESLAPVVSLAREGWRIAVVHGNGPQVGDELVRNEIARAEVAPLPLGVLVAATAGWIGYMIQQSIHDAIEELGTGRKVATVITQVMVDPLDPALTQPTKFIGHAIPEQRAQQLMNEGIPVKQDGNGRWRRAVASPEPKSIHEIETIRSLVTNGTIVIACGGGGMPVYNHPELGLEGIDAVVDKDLAAAVLARELEAELLLILTDVDGVFQDWGKPSQQRFDKLTADEAVRLNEQGVFGAGSMAPKVRAATEFVRATGGRAVITELSKGMEAVRGNAGTTIAD